MLTEDFVNVTLDNVSYCEDYLSYLKGNNLIDETSELNYIFEDIENTLWSDDVLLYDSKDMSFSEFAKTDAYYNVLSSLATVKLFIDTLKDNELCKYFKTNDDTLMAVKELKDRINENYDIVLQELNEDEDKKKEDLER